MPSPCICCEVHVFEKYPNTLLLNTIIKYNMNKHLEPLFKKSNFSPPGRDKFFELLLYTPKNLSIFLKSCGERNTDFVSFVTILPIDQIVYDWEIPCNINITYAQQEFELNLSKVQVKLNPVPCFPPRRIKYLFYTHNSTFSMILFVSV